VWPPSMASVRRAAYPSAGQRSARTVIGCRCELRVVSVITYPVVVDRILLHRKTEGIESPFARAPPAA
jgi:hypothetical protein